MNPFRRLARADAWSRLGLASEFPDLSLNDDSQVLPACKAFNVPKTSGSTPVEADINLPGELKDQVLVFQYKGKFHAIDHQCPHSAYPLSQGSLFDIEDFGITLSSGITCPKHGWSFDLFSGQGDRGNYKLKVWELELRDVQIAGNDEKEIWVRRKQRIG